MKPARAVSGLFWLSLVAAGGVLAGVPAAAESPLLQAMQEEMSRSVARLRLEAMDGPYFVEYAVDDLETMNLSASFGALLASQHERVRPLRVDVRVGSYDLDSSGFLTRDSWFDWSSDTDLVEEDDPAALRRDLWLATDAAYKKALETLARKKAVLENKVELEKIPDLARSEPQRSLELPAPMVFDAAAWEGKVRRLSGIFKEFPAIQESRVTVQAVSGARYLVNSEGTGIRQPWALVSLIARATTQASDGMALTHYVPFLATTMDRLPDEGDMASRIRRMAEELTQLAAAPVIDKYIGPVLFTGQAAAEVFAQMLAPHLSGQRPPLLEDERYAQVLPQNRLAERFGRRVLPSFFAVTDEPGRSEWQGHHLIGGYRFDDQGVPGQSVQLIEQGVLRQLAMSRRPRKEIQVSNGHGRAVSGEPVSAFVSNLIVQAGNGKSLAELKKDLIENCRVQGMDYGLMVTWMDVPEMSRRESSGRGENQKTSLNPPVLVYRVWVADGREELVRGLEFGEITPRTLKEILAAGTETAVWSRPVTPPRIGYGSPDSGPMGLSTLPVSIVAPAVLFDELELQGEQTPQKKPAFLPHPFFAK